MIGVRKTFSVILAIEFILACGSVYVELSGLERKVHLPSAPVMDRENEEWCVVTVDDSVVVHGTTSIGVDSSNYPHISYYDTTNGDLKYARWTGDRWSLETVDSEDDVGRSSSLAIDSEDNPHIAYSHINTTSYLRSYLKYTSWNGSSWLVEIVDSSPGVGYGDSIALDSSNLPHIAYADLHRHWLRYAHSTVSGWSIETIDAIEYQWPIFQWGSIAINSTDEPHLVYSTPPGKGTDLRYAYHADSDWNIETVMTSEKWISHSSIAFDSFGYPHLSFWDFEFYLWYARWNGSDWVFEIVDSASDWISTFTHLSLDSNDFPHIAYQAEEFGLKYASWNGSAWTIETIPDTQAHHASLTLDSLDKTHISFSTRDWTLKYATRGPCPENKPPISDAGPNQIVNEGDIVFFDGSSSYDADGNITNYSWDFDASIDNDGDGNYTNDVDATGPAPTHVYYDDGVYLVTLKVTDSSGLSDWDTCNITVLNVPPIPEWTSRSSDGTIPNPPYPEGKEILFEATIYDPGIYDTFTYDWDFGDGTILLDAGPSVVHAYGDNDTYIVVLTVTDDDGGVGIDDTPPLLTTNENPIPSISLTLCIFFEGTTPCEAIGEFSDPGWLDTHSAVWNYGDGTYETAVLTEENDPPDATGMNITSHIYGDNGDYNLTFTVVDDDGGVGTTWAEVYVENLPPSFLIDVPASMNEGEDFILGIMATDPGSDDLIININWGDGTSETKTYYNNGIGPDPPNSGEGTYPFTVYSNLTHTYGDNGNFTITVSVEDDDGSSVQDATIIEVINLPPEIGLPIGPLFYNEGEQFTLAAIGTDPGSDDINFTWTLELGPSWSAIYYNDGVAPDPPLSPWGTFPFVAVDTINHTYGDNGYYNVTITATDDDGGESTSVFSIEVRNLEPSLDIGGPYAGDENSPIVFTATATDQGSDDLTF
ncbi:MAG: PKD domain-containing protein, partial [Thermoplasmata archaeon]